MKTKKQFSLIGFQDAPVARLEDIHVNGVGDHKYRSRGRAIGNAVKKLVKLGYTEESARKIVYDAKDIADLNIECDEEDN